MGRSSDLLSKITSLTRPGAHAQYQIIREALMRACYRGLLRREPEKAVTDQFAYPPLSKKHEDKLTSLVTMFVDSPEFKLAWDKRSPHPADTWVRAEVLDGLKLWVDLGDMFVSHQCIRGDYEPIETQFLKSTLKSGMSFVDIGANIGWFTMLGASIVGQNGHVHSFEPRTSTFRYLQKSIAENGFDDRCETHNLALGAKAGEWNIGWSQNTPNPGGTWSVPHAALEASFKKTNHMLQRTKVAALDDIIGTRRVDIIKADIEGAEPLAMSGALKIISRDHPLILSEINYSAISQVAQTTAADYVRQITSYGYNCHELTRDGLGGGFTGESVVEKQVVNVVFKPN
jgi:FkbM family methyltransferase